MDFRAKSSTLAFLFVFSGAGFKDQVTQENVDFASELEAPLAQGIFPESVLISGKNWKLDYTIDLNLQDEMEKDFKRYNPDYGAFVAIDPESGEVLAMVSHLNEEVRFDALQDSSRFGIHGKNLATENIFPSASVFKIVTAAAAIDLNIVSSESVIPFNGRLHTLYRKNVTENLQNRWTNYFSLTKSFALSVNTVFGKLGKALGGGRLKSYAERLGFNQKIDADFPVQVSKMIEMESDWDVVEAASGYTRESTISPVHGALLAAVAANGGHWVSPRLIRQARFGERVVQTELKKERVLKSETAAALREMFKETVEAGTARGSFKKILSKWNRNGIFVGGKTGSLTSLDPKGKCDWFVGFGEFNGKKIAYAALTVNREKWKVKSSYLAKRSIETYFNL